MEVWSAEYNSRPHIEGTDAVERFHRFPTADHFHGSEFPALAIPIATQQHMLLKRILIHTGITPGKELVVVVGQRRHWGLRGAE